MGSIHLGPQNALATHALLGGGPLLPVHWGTFNLALHAWDDPVETLLRLAPDDGAQLWLPRLGEAFEPAHEHRLDPWWRGLDERTRRRLRARSTRLPDKVPWPLD